MKLPPPQWVATNSLLTKPRMIKEKGRLFARIEKVWFLLLPKAHRFDFKSEKSSQKRHLGGNADWVGEPNHARSGFGLSGLLAFMTGAAGRACR